MSTSSEQSGRRWRQLVLVVLLLWVVLFFRSHRLDSVPPGLDGDEMFSGPVILRFCTSTRPIWLLLLVTWTSRRPSSWLPGEVVTDPHVVPIEPGADAGVSEVGVGLYLPGTGERLPVFVDGQPQPNDVLIVTQVEIR